VAPSTASPAPGAGPHPLLVDAVPGLSAALAPPPVLPRDRTLVDAEQVSASQRWRLLTATARTIAADGYGPTTIERITSEAGVSKKTFYKFFVSKEAAFLACYEAVDPALAHVVDAARPEPSLAATVRSMVDAYLAMLTAAPAITRLFLFEALTATPAIRLARADTIARFATEVGSLIDEARERDPSVPVLDAAQVTAMLGGVNELCVDHITRHGIDGLASRAGDICGFVLRVLAAAPAPIGADG
jgi:AcrR family transcriptional regulator